MLWLIDIRKRGGEGKEPSRDLCKIIGKGVKLILKNTTHLFTICAHKWTDFFCSWFHPGERKTRSIPVWMKRSIIQRTWKTNKDISEGVVGELDFAIIQSFDDRGVCKTQEMYLGTSYSPSHLPVPSTDRFFHPTSSDGHKIQPRCKERLFRKFEVRKKALSSHFHLALCQQPGQRICLEIASAMFLPLAQPHGTQNFRNFCLPKHAKIHSLQKGFCHFERSKKFNSNEFWTLGGLKGRHTLGTLEQSIS